MREPTGRGLVHSGKRRESVLDRLRASAQPRSIVSLATELGVHVNTVRFHLDGLLRAGQVEQLPAEPSGPGRPPILFRATRRMDPDGPTNYRLLATMLTSQLTTNTPEPAITASNLGRRWGPRLLDQAQSGRVPARVKRAAAVSTLTQILGGLGFAPEPPTGPKDATIRLRHCPFVDLVTDVDAETGAGYGEVICSLHLGLMQGALASLSAPVTVDRLDPFVEPDLCVAHLGPVAVRGD